ncbi:MAG: SIMPL domain-containing protein [Spirochaetales bacterium]|nr:SIMPL domain-containing protein [Spirochaetales bacterium]
MKRFQTFIILAAVLWSASCVSESGPQITLTGRGVVRALPDQAAFNLTFREVGETTAQARELVNRKASRALSLLHEAGVDGENLRTTGVSYTRKTRWVDGEEIFLGQEAVQSLHVTVPLEEEGAGLSALIDSLTELDGLRMNGLAYQVSAQSAYREEARRLAMEDARSKAEQYARLGGVTLGKLTYLFEEDNSFQEGVSYNSRAPMAEVRSVDTEIQAGVNLITVVIQVTFEIK